MQFVDYNNVFIDKVCNLRVVKIAMSKFNVNLSA